MANESVPLTPVFVESDLKVVLEWGIKPKDLDIHLNFKVIDEDLNPYLCNVGFALTTCGSSSLDIDNRDGGNNGVETITVEKIGDYKYLLYISHFLDRFDTNEINLENSGAKVKVIQKNGDVVQFDMPVPATSSRRNTYWKVFCFSGETGLESITALNVLTYRRPRITDCDSVV
jgi:hypothetical protein